MAKILKSFWFTDASLIGIVVTENEVGTKKAYIGNCSGDNEDTDSKHIAVYGSPVVPGQLKEILKELGE